MIRTLSIIFASVLAVTPLAASAAVGPGTMLYGYMNQNLDSASAQLGQRVSIGGVHSQDNDINGATLYGHVCDVQKAGQGRNASIQLCFDRLHTRSGSSYAVDGRVTQVQVNTKNNALKEAGGAVAGMIVGNILGKAIGTNAGGLVGAAGGYMVARNNRANVTIPQGAQVTVQVLSSRRQAGY